MSLRNAGIILGLLIAVTAASQMLPSAAQFMQATNASMERMDREMAAAPMNGNVDHDFATMMMPHHQGAINMAKAELTYGKDPVINFTQPSVSPANAYGASVERVLVCR
jgi:uncharacterized protein (DUF305 family)